MSAVPLSITWHPTESSNAQDWPRPNLRSDRLMQLNIVLIDRMSPLKGGAS
jgi:hypothetical protein